MVYSRTKTHTHKHTHSEPVIIHACEEEIWGSVFTADVCVCVWCVSGSQISHLQQLSTHECESW